MITERWKDQLTLSGALTSGTHVVAEDLMGFPFLALRSGVRFDPVRPTVLLQPMQGGIIVRDRPRTVSRRPEQRLAVAPTLADAAVLGRQRWRTEGFLISDGGTIDGVNMPVPAAIRTTLAATRHSVQAADPLTVLQQSALMGEIGVLETGDAVVWIDPLVCLRGLTHTQARQVALAGSAKGTLLPQMVLRLPGGRVRLEFEGVRARPDINAPFTCNVSWQACGTAEVDTEALAATTTDVIVRSHQARLVRVGLVIPTGQRAPKAELTDPLEVYADPISADYVA